MPADVCEIHGPFGPARFCCACTRAKLEAENERLREVLRRIADLSCECDGYYTCNGCEKAGPNLASEALDVC